MLEQLLALRSFVALGALGALALVLVLRVLVSFEIRSVRKASPEMQLDLLHRVLNRHGDSGLGLSPKQKFQLAIERLSERRQRLTKLLVVLVLSTCVFVVVADRFFPSKPVTETREQSIGNAPALVPALDSVLPEASQRAPAPVNSQAAAAGLVFTLLSVKVAAGAGDYEAVRLTTFVNGFRNSYPTDSPWADLKDPALPASFPVDLEKDYRIAFKGLLKMKNGTERVYAPQPVDVFEWRGRDEERVYASAAPLIIKYKIASAAKAGPGVAQSSPSKHD